MALVAPKGRKHLSAEALFRVGRSGFTPIAEHRGGDATMALTDAMMLAGAMFSRQSLRCSPMIHSGERVICLRHINGLDVSLATRPGERYLILSVPSRDGPRA